MKKKRIFVVVVAAAVLIGVAACGSQQPSDTPEQSSSVQEDNQSGSGADLQDTAGQEDSAAARVAKPEDVHVNDLSEMTWEERTAWTAYLFDAYQNLDLEIIEKYYVGEFGYYAEALQNVSENPDDAALFKKVVGSMYYLPEYDVVIGKDPLYLLARAYSEVYADTSQIELRTTDGRSEEVWGEWSQITKEYANEIYNKYWDEAPYIVFTNTGSNMLSIVDGELKCNFSVYGSRALDGFLDYTYWHSFGDDFSSKEAGLDYGQLLFGGLGGYLIPNGAYERFWSGSELFTPECMQDGEALLKAYEELEPERKAELYIKYFNNDTDNTNRNAFVEQINNGYYKVAFFDNLSMYYVPLLPGKDNLNYSGVDLEKTALLDEAFFDFCEQEGIVVYVVRINRKTEVVSSVRISLDYFAYNMEKEGILVKNYE